VEADCACGKTAFIAPGNVGGLNDLTLGITSGIATPTGSQSACPKCAIESGTTNCVSPPVVIVNGACWVRRDLFLTIFEQTRWRYQFVVVSYVIMPEHFHLLISGTGESRSEGWLEHRPDKLLRGIRLFRDGIPLAYDELRNRG